MRLYVEFGCYGSSRSCLKSLAVGGWVAYMENNATLSEDWMGFSDRSSVAKIGSEMRENLAFKGKLGWFGLDWFSLVWFGFCHT